MKKRIPTALKLNKETVRRLATGELAAVQGAMRPRTYPTYCGDTDCLLCPSWAGTGF